MTDCSIPQFTIWGIEQSSFEFLNLHQKKYFNPNWICRASHAWVRVPKFGEFTLVTGFLNRGWLNALKNSARNSTLCLSPIGVVLCHRNIPIVGPWRLHDSTAGVPESAPLGSDKAGFVDPSGRTALSPGQHPVADPVWTDEPAAGQADIACHFRRPSLPRGERGNSSDLPATHKLRCDTGNPTKQGLAATDREFIGVAVDRPVAEVPRWIAAFRPEVVIVLRS